VISKVLIQYIKSLTQNKFRQKYNKFVAEGEKTGIEFLKHQKYSVDSVFTTSDHLLKLSTKYINEKNIHLISDKEMGQITAFKTSSNLLITLDKLVETLENTSLNREKSIFLDDVQDPGNLGTIIRIADWFGIKNVIRSPNSADFYNPKTVQASMGSMCNVKCVTSELEDLHLKYPDIPIMGTYMDGIAINEVQLPTYGILVIGNEGKGIRAINEKFITTKITIPGNESKIAESLNAAIACSIICSRW